MCRGGLGASAPNPRIQFEEFASSREVNRSLSFLVLPETSLHTPRYKMVSRSFCFTLNNYDALLDFEYPIVKEPKLRYAIYSEEVGEEGTPHLQGYMEFNEPVRFTYIKKTYAALNTAHFEPRHGTREQARDYCQKVDDPTFIDGPYIYGSWEHGGQGNRNDIAYVLEDVRKGKKPMEIAIDHPRVFLQYLRNIETYRILYFQGEPRNFKSRVFLFSGLARSGKSSAVYRFSPRVYSAHSSGWFDGYNGTDDVLFDDYNHPWYSYDEFMKMLDRYPQRVPFKGGFVNFAPKRIFITTTTKWTQWYEGPKVDLKAICGRIDVHLIFPINIF